MFLKKCLLIILLFPSIQIVPQDFHINVSSGIYQPFNYSIIEFSNTSTAGNGGLSFVAELNIDYGREELFIEPYIGFRYRNQSKPFDENIRNNYPFLYESGKSISAGIKKTLKFGEAYLSFLGGLSYDWSNYNIEYVDNNIGFIFQESSIEYQLGMQLNFKLFENIEPFVSFRYNIKESKEYENSINRFGYTIKSSSDYSIYALGISLNITNIL